MTDTFQISNNSGRILPICKNKSCLTKDKMTNKEFILQIIDKLNLMKKKTVITK